jgi:hypothetical protein
LNMKERKQGDKPSNAIPIKRGNFGDKKYN